MCEEIYEEKHKIIVISSYALCINSSFLLKVYNYQQELYVEIGINKFIIGVSPGGLVRDFKTWCVEQSGVYFS